MRRIISLLLIATLVLSVFLVGCGDKNNNEKEESKDLETEQGEPIEDETEDTEPEEKVEDANEEEVETSEDKDLKTVEEYKEIIKGDIGEGETIETIELVNNDIIITVDLGEEHELLSPKELAESRYSSITDTLLDEGGDLEDITIKFIDVGKITMNTSEKESNEFGDYFDSLDIQENFK